MIHFVSNTTVRFTFYKKLKKCILLIIRIGQTILIALYVNKNFYNIVKVGALPSTLLMLDAL